ncbi:MAG: hypothetical protein AAF196_09680 [Planctomycetota bacterium]
MSEQNDDFITFERALRDLDLQSDELKKLVSEGEIRAFRDGDSMKFKKEDLAALKSDAAGESVEEEEIVFADGLEDDTGMVTEEISAEDTLLADDDLVDDVDEEDDEPEAAVPAARRRPSPRARASRQEEEEDQSEPSWVVGLAVLTSVLLIWATMVVYNIASGATPDGLTGMFAPK